MMKKLKSLTDSNKLESIKFIPKKWNSDHSNEIENSCSSLHENVFVIK